MATTTVLWPSGGSNSALGSGGFTGSSNVSLDSTATFATHQYNNNSGTFGNKYGNFGLSIPAGSTITKVQIKYQGKESITGIIDITGRIFWTVSAASGSNHDQVLTTTLTYYTYDVTAERSWVVSDFADGTFFVSLESIATSSGKGVSVNALYVIVDYNAPQLPPIDASLQAVARAAYV